MIGVEPLLQTHFGDIQGSLGLATEGPKLATPTPSG